MTNLKELYMCRITGSNIKTLQVRLKQILSLDRHSGDIAQNNILHFSVITNEDMNRYTYIRYSNNMCDDHNDTTQNAPYLYNRYNMIYSQYRMINILQCRNWVAKSEISNFIIKVENYYSQRMFTTSYLKEGCGKLEN